MSDIEPQMTGNAVSIYENDSADEFPVLKAFQQYIDAEQAKARKRMLLLCAFFGFVMTVVIAVFVILLVHSSSRNQALNDRLVEYAMKDRGANNMPVVVQPPPTQESAALLALASKLEEMKKEISAERSRNETSPATELGKDTAKKTPSVEELEIQRLKTLLMAEKEKVAAEREKQRQLELEAYRREHYPELYGIKRPQPATKRASEVDKLRDEEKDADREIEEILKEIGTVDYFDDEDDDEQEERRPRAKRNRKKEKAPLPQANDEKTDTVEKPGTPKEEAALSSDGFKLPVDVKNPSGTSWTIPLD